MVLKSLYIALRSILRTVRTDGGRSLWTVDGARTSMRTVGSMVSRLGRSEGLRVNIGCVLKCPYCQLSFGENCYYNYNTVELNV